VQLRAVVPIAAVAALLVAATAWQGAPAASLETARQLPALGPGGPILVIADPADQFGRYYAEILRAEGLNEFSVADTSALSAPTLARHRIVLLAPTRLSDRQASRLASWVRAGGKLIAMRPDRRLAGLLGIRADSGQLDDGYLAIDSPGLTAATMQFHGTADDYALAGARAVATLYFNSTTPSPSPAVTLRDVGAHGGQAAAFAYDLARSVVYTRQGNPAWVGDERDGVAPIRSDDLFFGAKTGDEQPDWVDLDKVRIPQADEQQRLLANLIVQMSLDRVPLPRFWYLPRGLQAAVVLTGDDHGNGGTTRQFDAYMADSPPGCSLADWECVRSTSYVYPGTPISPAEASAYQAAGFEIGLHTSTDCADFDRTSLSREMTEQLKRFATRWPALSAPRTNRTHCIAWSDWAGEPKAELAHGIRLDANYYFWPANWVRDRAGLFTGSGLPMRFADTDGSLIDVYQAPTQLTDESGMDVAGTIHSLLDAALGPDGYYGVFTANMHTDTPDHPGADAIVAEARRRRVPVISAAQLLDWLDGRNGSSFEGLSFDGRSLRFGVDAAPGSHGLEAMLPANAGAGPLTRLTRDGEPVRCTIRIVKGIRYAVFDAASGAYVATYGQL
jgi:hypothetical protein